MVLPYLQGQPEEGPSTNVPVLSLLPGYLLPHCRCQAKEGAVEEGAAPLTSALLIIAALAPYDIPLHFLSAVIVNEKQYCNTSNYNQILIPQGSLKRKKMYLWL